MESIRFFTDDGISLEGDLRVDREPPLGTAVLFHPHSRHGGSKDHPLLWAIRNDLASRGFAALAFNFRGVMGSGGAYGGGHDELRDARAAVSRVRVESPKTPTFVCGWSFGAVVALREALEDPRVGGLALVGLPLRPPKDVDLPALPDPAELGSFGRPVLLLAGGADELCPAEELATFGATRSASVTIVEGADHYFEHREKEAATAVGDFAERLL